MCVYRTEDGKYTFCYEVCVASVCYHSDMSGTPDSTEWVAFQEIEIVENGQRREIYKTVEFNAPLEAVLSYLSMVLRETVCEIVDVWDEEDAA